MEDLIILFASPAAWAALATLIAMEVVLGIDNLIFISILCMAVTPLLGPYWLIAAVIGLRGVAQGFNLPLLISIMSQSVGPQDQAKAVALRITVNRLNALFVPVLMGAIAEFAGLEYSFYVVGAIGTVCLFGVAAWVARSPAFARSARQGAR